MSQIHGVRFNKSRICKISIYMGKSNTTPYSNHISDKKYENDEETSPINNCIFSCSLWLFPSVPIIRHYHISRTQLYHRPAGTVVKFFSIHYNYFPLLILRTSGPAPNVARPVPARGMSAKKGGADDYYRCRFAFDHELRDRKRSNRKVRIRHYQHRIGRRQRRGFARGTVRPGKWNWTQTVSGQRGRFLGAVYPQINQYGVLRHRWRSRLRKSSNGTAADQLTGSRAKWESSDSDSSSFEKRKMRLIT